MRTFRPIALSLATVITVSACDPSYELGARVQLGAPATDSCVLRSMRESFGRVPFESSSLPRGLYFSIAVPDSSAWFWRSSQLMLRHQPDSMLLLEVTSSWLGTARGVPVDQQRRFVAAASSTLETVRAVCAPASSALIECVARGSGGHPACDG